MTSSITSWKFRGFYILSLAGNLSFAFMLFTGPLSSQDPHFSQFQSQNIYLNPALAGSDGGLRIHSAGRYQWPKLSSSYISSLIASDYYIHRIRSGLGLLYLYDNTGQGIYICNRFGLSLSPSITLIKDKLVLKPGIEFAYQRKKIDYSKLNFGDQIDPKRGFVYNSNYQSNLALRSYPDLSAGISVYTRHFLLGFSTHHITEPDESYLLQGSLPSRYTFHGSGRIPAGRAGRDTIIISPSYYFMKQQDFTQIAANCIVSLSNYSLGFGYRDKDALIFYAGFRYKWFRIAYCYDYTISGLKNSYTGGSHEVMLSALLLQGVKTEEKLFWKGD